MQNKKETVEDHEDQTESEQRRAEQRQATRAFYCCRIVYRRIEEATRACAEEEETIYILRTRSQSLSAPLRMLLAEKGEVCLWRSAPSVEEVDDRREAASVLLRGEAPE